MHQVCDMCTPLERPWVRLLSLLTCTHLALCAGQTGPAAKALRRAIQLSLSSRLLPTAWFQLGISLERNGDTRGAQAALSQLNAIVVDLCNKKRRKEAVVRLREHAVERAARAAVKMLSREQVKSRSPPRVVEAPPRLMSATEILLEINESVAAEEPNARHLKAYRSLDLPRILTRLAPFFSPRLWCLSSFQEESLRSAELDTLVDGAAKSLGSMRKGTNPPDESSFEWNQEFLGE